jgi:hypothetical protein
MNLDLLTEFVAPQLDNLQPNVFFSEMVHHHFGVSMFVIYSIIHFQIGLLDEMALLPGHIVQIISRPWISSYRVMLKIRNKVQDMTDL